MASCKVCLVAIGGGLLGFSTALMVGAGEPDMKKMTDKVKKEADKAVEKGKEMMGGDDAAAQMEAFMKASMPGEMHKKLAWFEGNWELDVNSDYGGHKETATGTYKSELMYDGRFLMSSMTSTMMGAPMKGTSIMGYNNTSKQIESMWIDSMNTAMMSSKGTMDAAGKVISMAGECDDPMTGKRMKTREVMTILDENSYKMEFYMPGEDGKEMMGMWITFKRQK